MVVVTVTRRAWRRLLWNEIAAQGAIAISVALAMLVLLLLVGTQILNWRWLIALPMCTVAVGVSRAVQKLPGLYATAQLVDRRLKLADTLSTAFFFSMPESAERAGESARQAQRNRAIRVAENISVASAVPYALPRATYAAVLLALIGGSLFGLRYGIMHRLDLRPGLAHILKPSFGLDRTQLAKLRREQVTAEAEKLRKIQDAARRKSRDASANELREMYDTNPADSDKGRPGNQEQNTQAQDRNQHSDASTDGDVQDGPDGPNSPQGQAGVGQSGQQGRQAAGKQPTGSAAGSGMLSRIQDAMQNLLSRMGQQLSGALGRQQSAMSQSGRNGQSRESRSARSQSDQAKQQDGRESLAQQGEAAGGQNPQEGAGTAGRSAEQQPGKSPGNGIGNQDGRKDSELAEQLAAMGRIRQIIGQRSEHLTGDAEIEVHSGNPSISTPYLQKSAHHSNAGGEINRDEVPLVEQSYVERYFEEVRRLPLPVGSGGSRIRKVQRAIVPAR